MRRKRMLLACFLTLGLRKGGSVELKRNDGGKRQKKGTNRRGKKEQEGQKGTARNFQLAGTHVRPVAPYHHTELKMNE
jgi:hypothetical protein